jgi:hypothetical protein
MVRTITTRLIPAPYERNTESDSMKLRPATAPAMRLRNIGRVHDREAMP